MKEPQLPPPGADIPIRPFMETKRPTRYLVIGAGSRGNAYARAVTRTTPGTIHAVAEPYPFKRREFGQNYIWGLKGAPKPGQEFTDWRDWLVWETERRKKVSTSSNSIDDAVGVDGVFICTLDETHVEIIQAIAPLNLHILCEKPLALSLQDCLTVYRTLQPPTHPNAGASAPTAIFSIGHVLRYSPHNKLLRKLLLEDRVIGDIVSLEHTEPVGWWHFSHSYVRGNWRRATPSGDGSLLTKSCHDIDFILWLLCSPTSLEDAGAKGQGSHFPRSISSFGSLTQFRKARKPVNAGTATNCVECPAASECSYNAMQIYGRHLEHGDRGWPVNIVVPDIEDVYVTKGQDGATAALLAKLAEDYDVTVQSDADIAARPWYGRCVYEADNNVADDQVVTFKWDDEIAAPHRLAKTASFHMIAPTEKQCVRRGRVYGTTGEIEYDSTTISIYDFATGKTVVHDVPKPPPERAESHGGGDFGLAGQYVSAVEAVVNGGLDIQTAQARFIGCTLEEAVQSHAVVFAAEEARREERVVHWEDWWEKKLKHQSVKV
ncbi:Oxidoreductase N-terminal [Penicillium malachiteum]|uniref:Oxidoreductase N-terminal n=1 Tax=Penicillium malachiteum TaxID=1324776 RepID=UPI0025466332|nr:Oxidoreductase N-terminal [Penicillium malachiteum]KAJ5735522.1 Oxidoreductase N-terminal [Penicillium malachiteum]